MLQNQQLIPIFDLLQLLRKLLSIFLSNNSGPSNSFNIFGYFHCLHAQSCILTMKSRHKHRIFTDRVHQLISSCIQSFQFHIVLIIYEGLWLDFLFVQFVKLDIVVGLVLLLHVFVVSGVLGNYLKLGLLGWDGLRKLAFVFWHSLC